MKFKFISNACGEFEGSKGTRLLMDPWLDNGVFEGSWCHYPPLVTKHSDLQDVDFIYLSHIHPDHYDERFFDYDKEKPIIILDNKYNFLENNLRKKGYKNILKIKDQETLKYKEFSITLFEPFVNNVFHESALGNLIDSAIVIEDLDGTKAFNANDNTPDKSACEMLKKRFGIFDLAMINYNSAGPYPSCFSNFSLEKKIDEHKKVLKRNIYHLISCCNILKPKVVLPFAGAYVLGGKEWRKNKFLGTTTVDKCASLVEEMSDHKAIAMNENNIFNLNTLEMNSEYVPINELEMGEYIAKVLSKVKYPYENEELPDIDKLENTIKNSIKALKERSQKYKIKVKSKIILKLRQKSYLINKGDPKFNTELIFSLDERLMKRILERKSQWNSAEIGCHIDIFRSPNNYEIDAHTMMQFFHL